MMQTLKVLFWKEWRQNLKVALIGTAIAAVLVAHFIRTTSKSFFSEGYVSYILVVLWSLAALRLGAVAISSEIEAGTLPLLRLLPISQSQVWRIKILYSLSTFAQFVLFTLIVFAAEAFFMRRLGSWQDMKWVIEIVPGWIFKSLVLFSVSVYVSNFCDRPLYAMLLTPIVLIIWYILLLPLMGLSLVPLAIFAMRHSDLYATSNLAANLIALISIPHFLALSHNAYLNPSKQALTYWKSRLLEFVRPIFVIGAAILAGDILLAI